MNKGGTSLNKTSSKYRINLMCGTGTESMWCQEVSLQGNVPLQTLLNNQSLSMYMYTGICISYFTMSIISGLDYWTTRLTLFCTFVTYEQNAKIAPCIQWTWRLASLASFAMYLFLLTTVLQEQVIKNPHWDLPRDPNQYEMPIP